MRNPNSPEQDFSEQDEFYAKITRIFLRLILVVLSLVAANLIWQQFPLYNILMIGVVFVFFAAMDFVVSSDTYNLVYSMLLWSLAILTTNFMWTYNGIFSSAMLVLPGILMLAILFNRQLLFYSLLVFVLGVIISLGIGHAEELIPLQDISIDNAWPRVGFTFILTAIFSGLLHYFFHSVAEFIEILQNKLQIYKRLHTQYKEVVGYDTVIKLPTEYSCNKVFNNLMSNLYLPSGVLGCILINLKNIERLKSNLGHKLAEKIMIQLGKKLLGFSSEATRLFVFRGNEFVILSKEKSRDEIKKLSQKLVLCITESLIVEDHEVELLAGIGVAFAPFDGRDLDSLLKAAHLACDKANNDIASNIVFFDETMRANADFNYTLIRDMKKALINGEFELHYQPKIHLQTGNIVGVEALIRWNKPHNGLIRPDMFIPLAEESGLIIEIGKWVLQEACYQCKAWHQQGLAKLTIAVNVSPVQFRKSNFPYVVMQALQDVQLRPEFLEIEITESALGDQYATIRSQIQSLATKGVTIAIDDFGTGYSNLGHLSKFKISCLKIDQSFIRHAPSNQQDLHIVGALLQLSQGLGLSTVAEGIEHLEHVQLLTELGCHYGQGYFWSKPLPNEEFIEFVQHYTPLLINNHRGGAY